MPNTITGIKTMHKQTNKRRRRRQQDDNKTMRKGTQTKRRQCSKSDYGFCLLHSLFHCLNNILSTSTSRSLAYSFTFIFRCMAKKNFCTVSFFLVVSFVSFDWFDWSVCWVKVGNCQYTLTNTCVFFWAPARFTWSVIMIIVFRCSQLHPSLFSDI